METMETKWNTSIYDEWIICGKMMGKYGFMWQKDGTNWQK